MSLCFFFLMEKTHSNIKQIFCEKLLLKHKLISSNVSVFLSITGKTHFNIKHIVHVFLFNIRILKIFEYYLTVDKKFRY